MSTKEKPPISYLEYLSLVFIALKLSGKINWSWMLVLSPLFIMGLFMIIGFVLDVIIAKMKNNNKDVGIPVKSKWQQRMEEMQENAKRNK